MLTLFYWYEIKAAQCNHIGVAEWINWYYWTSSTLEKCGGT